MCGTGPLAQLLSAHDVDAEGLGFESGLVKSAQFRQQLAIAATFLRNCVAQALSRGNGPAARCTLRRNTASMKKI